MVAEIGPQPDGTEVAAEVVSAVMEGVTEGVVVTPPGVELGTGVAQYCDKRSRPIRASSPAGRSASASWNCCSEPVQSPLVISW